MRATPDVRSAVSAVVVNYNAGPHLEPCLNSLRAAGVQEIVVVDNASEDDSAEVVGALTPPVRWLPARANLGYGRAANLGAAVVAGQYVLVCNPDLVVCADAVQALLCRLRAEPDLGLVGPRMLNPDGSLYPSARVFPDLVDAAGHGLLGLVKPDNRFTRRYRLLDWDHRTPRRVDWVSGACFLIRRQLWDALGGFDPRYFMYLEDVDLCWRAGRSGWAVGYDPGAEVVHAQGASANQHPYRMLAAHHRSMWRFARRSTTGAGRVALPFVALGLLARLVASALCHRFGCRLKGPVRGSADRRVP